MSDSEIGEKLNINQSTSYRHRRNSLEEIKKQLNRLLRRCRRCRQIGVEAAGKDSGLDWHQIDSLEHGNDKTWNVYQKLLDFYGKQIKIELIERKRK